MRAFIPACLLLLACWLASDPVRSQLPTQFILEATLTGDFSELPDQGLTPGPVFGFSVATDGDWLAVGAPNTTFIGGSYGLASHGAVFLFRRSGGNWQYMQRILHPAWGDSQCGYSVALSVPYLVVGCNQADEISNNPPTEAGIARWYRLDGAGTHWQLESGYHGPPGMRCGNSVAISDVHADGSAVLAIGCPGMFPEHGVVVTYSYDPGLPGWTGPEFIFAGDGAPGDRFGASLALWRSTEGPAAQRLAVGAPSKNQGSASNAGAVYLFDGPGWNPIATYTHPAPTFYPDTSFGHALALNQTQLIVGSPGGTSGNCPDPDPLSAPRCGFVRRYQPDEPIPLAEGGSAVNALGHPPGEQLEMRFGNAVALGPHNWIAVAAHWTDGHDHNGQLAEMTGLVELRRAGDGGYSSSHNDQQVALRPDPLPPEGLANGMFGNSIDFSATHLAVGYPFAGNFAGRQGEVRVYRLQLADALFSDRFETP